MLERETNRVKAADKAAKDIKVHTVVFVVTNTSSSVEGTLISRSAE